MVLLDDIFTSNVYSPVVSLAPIESATGKASVKDALVPSINENSISPDVIVVVVSPTLEYVKNAKLAAVVVITRAKIPKMIAYLLEEACVLSKLAPPHVYYLLTCYC